MEQSRLIAAQLCASRPLQTLWAWTQMCWACGRRARVVADARGRVKFRLRAKPDSADMDSLNVRETGATCSCVQDWRSR